jgi:hypothetical protein
MTEQNATPTGDVEMMHFSDYDLEAVSKATTWMRTVSSLIYFYAAIQVILIGISGIFLGGFRVLSSVVGAIAFTGHVATIVVLFMGAIFLRKACIAFYDGIAESTETPLAEGFGKLKTFWLFLGIFGLLSLVGPLLTLGIIAL